MYDLQNNTLKQIKYKGYAGIFHSYPQFDKDDNIIFQGYIREEFKYGIMDSFNHKSHIFRLKINF